MTKFSNLVSHEKPFHDYKCYLGDLNYRIDEDNKVIRQKVADKEYSSLAEKDQLLNQRKLSPFLQHFYEGELSFDPTYRYDKNTDNYDTSKKNRAPAWCDRILFSRDSSCKAYLYQDMHSGDDAKAALPEFYGRSEHRFSDHRPVIAKYKVQVITSTKAKKEIMSTLIANDLLEGGKITIDNIQKVRDRDYSATVRTLTNAIQPPNYLVVGDVQLSLNNSNTEEKAENRFDWFSQLVYSEV